MSPGKPVSRSEAIAPMAAGARLEAMRRRVRVSRLAVWTVIAAGPIALGVTLTCTPTTAEAASSTKPTAAPTTTVAADPAGYAQQFLRTWLRSSTKDEASAQARHAQSMAPGIDLPEAAADAQPAPEVVTAVRSAQRDADASSLHATLTGHAETVSGAAFSPGSYTLATADTDGTVRTTPSGCGTRPPENPAPNSPDT